MASKTLRCYAEGRDGDWEAICLDLDIAVQGGSFEEVFASLQEAISLYLETVADLPPKERTSLLDRPAPRLGSPDCRIMEDNVPGLMSALSLWQATDTTRIFPATSPL